VPVSLNALGLRHAGHHGGPHVAHECHPAFAEASLHSPRYRCDAVATVESSLLAFPIERFREALGEDEKFRAFWTGRLAREVHALRSQCERLALHSAAERIEHYIESEGDNGRLELSRTRKAWAGELGLTHEAVYRTLSGLQRAGRVAAVEKDGMLVLTVKREKKPQMKMSCAHENSLIALAARSCGCGCARVSPTCWACAARA
jgi:hypothetical protein